MNHAKQCQLHQTVLASLLSARCVGLLLVLSSVTLVEELAMVGLAVEDLGFVGVFRSRLVSALASEYIAAVGETVGAVVEVVLFTDQYTVCG